jgi:hypothetical protein
LVITLLRDVKSDEFSPHEGSGVMMNFHTYSVVGRLRLAVCINPNSLVLSDFLSVWRYTLAVQNMTCARRADVSLPPAVAGMTTLESVEIGTD